MVQTSQELASGARRLTPMLRQYLDAKAQCPANSILMFRMGDFFELFFEDAKTAAHELDLTLTARDKTEDPIPMAGVPHHAVSGYIARLVERGYTVALCDQVEDPRKAKGLVKREITRLITPGTVGDLDAIDPASSLYLSCVCAIDERPGYLALAMLDMLVGELLLTVCETACLGDELRRMGVREVLTASNVETLTRNALAGTRVSIRAVPEESLCDDVAATRILTERLGVGSHATLEKFDQASRRALAQVITFAESTQRRKLRHLMMPRYYTINDFLVVDETTRRNLELETTHMEGAKRGSLLWHLNRCRSSLGARLLHQWLLFPLQNTARINARLDAVAGLKEKRQLRESIQSNLDGVRDIERLVGRIAIDCASPRDLGALRESLRRVPLLQQQFAGESSKLASLWQTLDVAADVCALLDRALVDEPPVHTLDAGIFRRGFCEQLDVLITLSGEGHEFLADLERRERKRSGINNLKVRYNRVFGYYLEITKANLGQVPSDYVRRQTLVNGERYITAELKAYEDRVLHADEQRKDRELQLYKELLASLAPHTQRLRNIARLVAQTDVFASLAQVADEQRYVRPEISEDPVVDLQEARHPVLEVLLPAGERFVPNDVQLNAETRQLMIVTGPNMGGKSTVLRQTALCTLLAHMGAFVPARHARIGKCDRLFTRVGASDNLGRGHSTFMVEMMETAAILKHATAHSLVILDEIGRGTSTYDGLSIACAVAEYLHDHIGCRAMFATHYHELTDLVRSRPRIVNACLAVKEIDGAVVFLRRLVDGAANRSYGIEVARLAGVPEAVLMRSRAILADLELNGNAPVSHAAPPASQKVLEPVSQVEKELAALQPLHMTPMQALSTLQRLSEQVLRT